MTKKKKMQQFFSQKLLSNNNKKKTTQVNEKHLDNLENHSNNIYNIQQNFSLKKENEDIYIRSSQSITKQQAKYNIIQFQNTTL